MRESSTVPHLHLQVARESIPLGCEPPANRTEGGGPGIRGSKLNKFEHVQVGSLYSGIQAEKRLNMSGGVLV